LDPPADAFGRPRIAGFDVAADGETIGLDRRAPAQFQDLPVASLRRVSARRAATLASTPLLGMSGRRSSSASRTFARTQASFRGRARNMLRATQRTAVAPVIHNKLDSRPTGIIYINLINSIIGSAR
jgi:hypothetical protein